MLSWNSAVVSIQCLERDRFPQTDFCTRNILEDRQLIEKKKLLVPLFQELKM